MNLQSKTYLDNLKQKYRSYGDNDSLMALAEAESLDERVRSLKIYREQDKTQELIQAVIKRYRTCLSKLVNPDIGRKMTDEERAYCFASMEWCKFTLDIVGENPDTLENQVDEMVVSFARKSGIAN